MDSNTLKIVSTALLSMVPTFEGRYALITAIGMGIPFGFSFLLAVVCSTIPMPFVMLLAKPFLAWLYRLPIRPIQKFAAFIDRKGERGRVQLQKSQEDGAAARLKKFFNPEIIELIALFIFVAVPLPGTGVWTGSFLSVLLNMDRKKSAISIMLGNVCACLITGLLTAGLVKLF